MAFNFLVLIQDIVFKYQPKKDRILIIPILFNDLKWKVAMVWREMGIDPMFNNCLICEQ